MLIALQWDSQEKDEHAGQCRRAKVRPGERDDYEQLHGADPQVVDEDGHPVEFLNVV